VRKDILTSFVYQRVEAVDIYDSNHTEGTEVASTGMGKSGVGCIHASKLCKTPIWALAHCLE